MWAYIVRRLLLAIPTVLGIMLLTFLLFSVVTKDPARVYAGKHATEEVLTAIRHRMGLDKPRWINLPLFRETHQVGDLFNAQFPDMLMFRFPESMRYDESVWKIFARKAPISFLIQLPIFIIELGGSLVLALLCAAWRGRVLDRTITLVAVLTMSIPSLCVYLYAQQFFGADLRLFPVGGWDIGWRALQFATLPILIGAAMSVGGGARFYRTVVLDEISGEYVRTARAKGVASGNVLMTHVLANVMIPVITSTVTALPLLFTGALFLERIFQIPGLGGLLLEALDNNDRPVVMFLVYITSIIYCLALVATDVCYAIADPRVSLH